MKIYNLPFDLAQEEFNKGEKVIIRKYRSEKNSHRNKIILHRNMINMVMSGTKTIAYAEDSTTIDNNEFLILSKGNCLTTEMLPDTSEFTSMLIYFDNDLLTDFFVKYGNKTVDRDRQHKKPFLRFKQDAFIRNYVASLDSLLKTQSSISSEMKMIKLEELFVYLLQTDAAKLLSLQIVSQFDEDLQIKRAIESNIGNPVTIEELAFMCNCSLSTFKRRFTKVYGTSPQKWLLQEKMQLAATLLRHADEKPGMVYQKVGYENHSSFSKSFKQFHGITPKEFQSTELNFQR